VERNLRLLVKKSNSSNGRIHGNYISRIKLRKYYKALFSDAQQAWKNIIVKVRKK
jgi:uncharacterized protein (DUF302 family)